MCYIRYIVPAIFQVVIQERNYEIHITLRMHSLIFKIVIFMVTNIHPTNQTNSVYSTNLWLFPEYPLTVCCSLWVCSFHPDDLLNNSHTADRFSRCVVFSFSLFFWVLFRKLCYYKFIVLSTLLTAVQHLHSSTPFPGLSGYGKFLTATLLGCLNVYCNS